MNGKPIAMVFVAGGLCGLLLTAGTLALFSAGTGTQTNTLVSGNVTLGAPSSTLINVTGLMPGMSDTRTYSVTYTGSAPAWVGVLPKVSGDLATCDGGKLTMTMADSANPAVTYAWNSATPQVVRTGGAPVPASTGASWTFTVRWELDLTAGNACQNKSATLELETVAVQSEMNTNATNDGPVDWGAGGAPAAAAVDQEYYNPAPLGMTGVGLGTQIGQTFTAGVSGQLHRVQLSFYNAPSPPTVQIFATVGGVPAGAPLATGTLTSGIPVAYAPPALMVEYTFTSPPALTAGTQYAIVITPAGGHVGGLPFQDPGGYTGGTALSNSGSWTPAPSVDLIFRTWMQ